MTLSAALGTAMTSLSTIQTKLAVASSNIANADDAGYTVKTAQQTSVVTSNVGAGVDVAAIISKVDSNLVRSIMGATSTQAGSEITLSYLTRLDEVLGSLADDSTGDTLAADLTELQSLLEKLAATPESATLAGEVAAQMDDALTSLRSLSADVQSLRADADDALADSVDAVNNALHQIDSLNEDIVRAKAAGRSTADLEDQRNAALALVAEQVQVSYFTDSTGAMQVYTASGQVLVAGDVHELSFTASSPVNSSTAYPDQLSGITVNGADITGQLGSGAMAALVSLRDDTLTDVQDSLDVSATDLRDVINDLANQASASPPPDSLTGTKENAASDAFSGIGTLVVAATDSDGIITDYAELDLSLYADVGSLVAALDALSGVSAQLDVDGHLVIAAEDATGGIAVSGGDVGGETLSGWFGLNDLITGDDASTMTLTDQFAADSSRFPTAALTGAAIGETAVAVGSGAMPQAMADALGQAQLAEKAGALVSLSATLLDAAESKAASAETALSALTDTFSSNYGVNIDEETARISQLEDAYSASAQILSAVQEMFDQLLQAVR